MDEMKIVSGFSRGLVSKIVQGLLCKKLGCKMELKLNEFTATVTDGKIHLHLDIDADMDKAELTKLLKQAGVV